MKKKISLLLLIIIVIVPSLFACSMSYFGVIGTSLYGTVYSRYSVFNQVTAVVDILRQYGGAAKAVARITGSSCVITQGSNLTLLTSQSQIMSWDSYGEAVKGRLYSLNILSSWTIGYNCKLKGSFSGKGDWQNPESKGPGGGGSLDISMAYEYETSASGSCIYYCGATSR